VIYNDQSLQCSSRSKDGADNDYEKVRNRGRQAFEKEHFQGAQVDGGACEPGAVKHKQARRNGDAAGPPFAGDEKYQKEEREERKNARTDIGFPLSHDQNLSMIR